MNVPLAIIGSPWCMARPARPAAEAAIVAAVARAIGPKRSLNAVARDIARWVTADLVAYLDLDLSDPMIAALAELEDQTSPTAYSLLARCPSINTAEDFLERRVKRYRARGCRQLSEAGRQRETNEIAREIEQMLAKRYAKHLRK